MRRLTGLVFACAVLGGCSTAVYEKEGAKLAVAASNLAGAFPKDPEVEAAAAAPDEAVARIGWVLNNGPVVFSQDCLTRAHDFRASVTRSLSAPEAVQDANYKVGLQTLGACALQPIGDEVPVAPAPTAVSDDCVELPAAAALAPGWKTSFLASRCRAVRDAQTPLKLSPAPPAAAGKYNLDHYVKAIADYADAVKAITASTSLSDVNSALDKAGTAIDGLVATAEPGRDSSPYTKLLAAVAKMGVEQAQHDALKKAVTAFNAAWSTAAPSVKMAARVRYAKILEDRAMANFGYARAAQVFLNKPKSYGAPAERLALYDTLAAKVEESAGRLKAAEVDPGVALDAFARANHELAEALSDPKRQVAAVDAEIQSLETLVAALKT